MAGFRGPLFLLALAAAPQAGFYGPLPTHIGADGQQRAGFVSPIPVLNLGAGQAVTPTPEPARRTGGLRPNILRDDQDIFDLIVALTLADP